MSWALDFSLIALAIWMYLLAFRGFFWLARERDGNDCPLPNAWPSVVAVVPARDEAETIAASLASLIAQDYPGDFRIVLVDDQSSDGTGDIAAGLDGKGRLAILRGGERPDGWTGKLWALNQGVAHLSGTNTPDYFWFTDADIAHAPDNLRHLAARAEAGNFQLVSLMAKLRCESFAERFLVPAFVFFFAMLYPFAWVNDARNRTAAAAGGCVLVTREALMKADGIAAIRHEIIDDCALAARIKAHGPIWLGLTERAVSLRAYPALGAIRQMVSRSAYAQLKWSPVILLGTIFGMVVTYMMPPFFALAGTGGARIMGLAAWAGMAAAYEPMLAFYRRSPLWGLLLPVIGIVYTLFTLDSAVQFWRGRGGMWKGRAQAMGKA